MNDDFFSNFRQSPRAEFTQSLYAKLMQDAKAGPFIGRHSTAKRIAYALAALCLIFAVTIAVSPAVRAAALAAVEQIIAKITMRGITVWVYEELPPASTAESESYGEIWTPVSPKDISTDYSFFAKLPTWVPSNYVLQERAALYYGSMYNESPSSALFEWKDKAGEKLQLWIQKGSCPNGPLYDPNGPLHDRRSDCTLEAYIVVGLDSEPQVVAINGQPAIFFRGVMGLADLSGSVRKWNPSRWKSSKDVTKGASMIWESDGRTFVLIVESMTITKEDIIRLAESIPQ